MVTNNKLTQENWKHMIIHSSRNGNNLLIHDPEAVVRRCSVKKVFFEILQNSQENTCARVSFLLSCRPEACNFIEKETLAQMFSCEFCKISKNTFFHRKSLVAASDDHHLIRGSKILTAEKLTSKEIYGILIF